MTSVPTRRALGLAALAASLAACVDPGRGKPTATAEPPVAPATPPPSTGNTIGSGTVKVALILPLGGPGQGAVAAASLRNAADLALSEFQNPDLTILVKDDRGTPDGARQAATDAIGEGAELIIGPLFAPSVSAAGTVARGAGKPVIAFSTDANVAAPSVYLLSFMAQSEVDRIVEYAVAQGRKSYAAMIPDTSYGAIVEARFREEAARRGARVVGIEHYAAGQAQAAVQRLGPSITGGAAQADAIFIPDSGDHLAAIGTALTAAGFDPARVKPLGTGVWNDPRAFNVPAFQGGWFAAPETAGFAAFSGRYRARFGTDPTRIATLAYDAVSLAAALARIQGSQRFAEAALTNPSGFAGVDGVFRFRPDGTSERALSVLEIRAGAATPISPAPKTLGPSGI